ncbi:uncharacterized protein LOC116841367 isoform X2 [Odontomachus brunneus]|uniref:uncharacterized protein LOC116841367 isoform X2 n=1 Tax=Odontomachus brunneus TaxID=486640 RepID=UPI0013F21C64|nr:uncharacterized protein LOC116841367 isoform X2 [Odontomachus brunneus]
MVQDYHFTVNVNYRIPKDSKKRKKWLDTMELSNRDIPEIAYICSLHFKESDLDRTSLSSIRIRPGAVPFVYTDKIKQYQGYLNVNNDEPPVKQEKLIKTDLLGEIENSMEIEEICEHKEKCLLKVENPIEIQEICENAENISQQGFSTPPRSINQETVVSPYLSENTPRKQMLRNALMHMKKEFRKKLQIVQQKQQRTMKYVAKMKDILTSLRNKNLLNAEQLDVLKDLDLLFSSNNKGTKKWTTK